MLGQIACLPSCSGCCHWLFHCCCLYQFMQKPLIPCFEFSFVYLYSHIAVITVTGTVMLHLGHNTPGNQQSFHHQGRQVECRSPCKLGDAYNLSLVPSHCWWQTYNGSTDGIVLPSASLLVLSGSGAIAFMQHLFTNFIPNAYASKRISHKRHCMPSCAPIILCSRILVCSLSCWAMFHTTRQFQNYDSKHSNITVACVFYKRLVIMYIFCS